MRTPAGGRGGSAGRVLCWRGRAGFAWGRQGGGQPGEQDVQAAFEFGAAVVDGQDGVRGQFVPPV